jgi:hypothetical protein
MTDTRTYQADAADEWLPLRIAGSLDNGALDTEYTPRPERIICAGDERHSDHERRIAALELQVHRLMNAEPDSDGLTAAYMLGAYDGKHGTGTGKEYAAIGASVPWESIGHCLSVAIYGASPQRQTAQAALDWWHAHAPKEAAA